MQCVANVSGICFSLDAFFLLKICTFFVPRFGWFLFRRRKSTLSHIPCSFFFRLFTFLLAPLSLSFQSGPLVSLTCASAAPAECHFKNVMTFCCWEKQMHDFIFAMIPFSCSTCRFYSCCFLDRTSKRQSFFFSGKFTICS